MSFSTFSFRAGRVLTCVFRNNFRSGHLDHLCGGTLVGENGCIDDLADRKDILLQVVLTHPEGGSMGVKAVIKRVPNEIGRGLVSPDILDQQGIGYALYELSVVQARGGFRKSICFSDPNLERPFFK